MAREDGTLDESRMSIGEHLEELRWHVLRAVITIGVLLCGALYFQDHLMDFATWPHRRVAGSVREDRIGADLESDLKKSLFAIQERDEKLQKGLDDGERKLAQLKRNLDPAAVEKRLGELKEQQAALDEKIDELRLETQAALDSGKKPTPAGVVAFSTRREKLIAERKELHARVESEALAFLDKHANVPKMDLTQLTYTEAFLSSLKLCLVVALFVGSPIVVREMWSFVAKGLYGHEKRYVRLFGPLSFVAFILGGAFGYFILIPVGLKFLISYASSELVGATIAVGDYLSLFIVMTLIMGAIFELPLVMVFTTLLGITDAPTFRKFRKHFFFGSFVASAILTPTPDPFTQVLMAGPLYGLFEVGIALSAFIGKGRGPGEEVKKIEEKKPEEEKKPAGAKKATKKSARHKKHSARAAAAVAAEAAAPAPPPPPAPPVAPGPVIPVAPPPQTVGRPRTVPELSEAPPAEPELIGGESDDSREGPFPPSDEAPALGYEDTQPEPTEGGSTYFDPSVEDPNFDQMGKQLVGPTGDEPIGGDEPPAPGRAGGAESG